MRVLASLVILLCLVGLSKQSFPNDVKWRQVNVWKFGWDNNNATIWLAAGNVTFWKALAVYGDNATVRPSNESQLINFINNTYCLGNDSCMAFMPKNDIRFYYFTKYSTSLGLTASHPYFWMWVTRKSYGTDSQKFITCNTGYFPRWDWIYVCQAFMPSMNTAWYYGARWFCGSNNYYLDCGGTGYQLPNGYENGNMTAITSATSQVYVPCCIIQVTTSMPYIP